MLGTFLDVFRLRQYFDAATRAREFAGDVLEDLGFLDLARRALIRLPTDRLEVAHPDPFGAFEPMPIPELERHRVALAATGGSGALAAVVGAGRALEECGITPAVLSMCSGSALFGFPLGAGVPAAEVAEFVLALEPEDYVDVDWGALARLGPRLARGFAGIVCGERLESTYRAWLGDRTLGTLAIPTYAPVWNIERNRLEYLGPRTHPDMTIARAVRMAVSLPLFFEPVRMDGGSWCDGGIVDIFPVVPLLDIEEPCGVVLALNCFYPPEFAGEDATGWERHAGSILYVASQVRTCQQVELARQNLGRLRRHSDVVLVHPVPYEKVQGLGFYRQFLDTSEWPDFMRDARTACRDALRARAADVRELGPGFAAADSSE
ncbi:MAG TPA: patatin-like phospholipase family protein [Acidimicrobiia bacterium]|nr:patatin-like phospholipase family protein [Acidimicrobiia bacterium]